METPDLLSLHLKIEAAVQEIAKDGKLEKHELPALVLLITELILTPASAKMTSETIIAKMGQMYDYIMTHYKLYPIEEADKLTYKALFDIAVKLVVFDPRLKKLGKKCFPCL